MNWYWETPRQKLEKHKLKNVPHERMFDMLLAVIDTIRHLDDICL